MPSWIFNVVRSSDPVPSESPANTNFIPACLSKNKHLAVGIPKPRKGDSDLKKQNLFGKWKKNNVIAGVQKIRNNDNDL